MNFKKIAIKIAKSNTLEGNWVTIIWFTEMLLLFVIGKKTNFEFFKVISYSLAILGFINRIVCDINPICVVQGKDSKSPISSTEV